MTTVIKPQQKEELTTGQWITIGLIAAIAGVAAVLLAQAVALAIWPDLALFKPLESFARSALFTLVPALGATGVFAWLAARKEEPVRAFRRVALVVLLLSLIPDYVLPVPHRTLLASSVAALLHVVAAVVTVLIITAGYRRLSGN